MSVTGSVFAETLLVRSVTVMSLTVTDVTVHPLGIRGTLVVTLVSNSLMVPFTIALLVWLSYRYIRQPTSARAAWVGFAAALAALARAEAILLVPLLLLPLFWRHSGGHARICCQRCHRASGG